MVILWCKIDLHKRMNTSLLLVGGVTSALPALFVKQYLHSKQSYWIALSGISYAILTYVYILLLKNTSVSILYPLLKVFSILFVIGTGLCFFGEQITINIAAGILLGVGSIYLLSNSTPQ
jgi:multidrug transporter EmrE-like cation transporter